MSSAAEILVIIVSIVLVLFLIVSIILGIYLIRLSAEIRKIAKSAGETVDVVGEVLRGAAKLASPVFIARALSEFFTNMQKKSKKGDK